VKLKTLTNGLFKDNPVFYQMLGMCPTLAVTTSAENGMGMGLATTAVLVLANVVISLMRNFIPSKIRIPAFIVVIATFVTIVGMVMEGFVPALFASLGLFIPLIVVNCLILARAEAFAFKNGVVDSALDGVGMGLGFTLALTILGAVREVFGAGAIFGIELFGKSFEPALIMILPPGAFLALGLILAGINVYQAKKAKAA
jgi:electron transport complex protein RnfE